MKKDLTFLYALTELAYWMGFASILAFVSMYLLSADVSNSVIGIVIAAGGTLSALSQPVLGTLSDRFPKFSVRRILTILAVLITACAVLMAAGSSPRPVLSCILYGVCIMVLQIMQPFVNSLGMKCLNDGCRLDFGIARAAGSVGYALAAYLLGVLAEKSGASVIPVFMAAAYLVFLATLLFYPKSGTAGDMVSGTGNGANSAAAFFSKYRRFTVLLCGLIFIYFGHTLINSFTLQIMMIKGGGSREMGTATSIAAILELLMMFVFTRVMKYFSLKSLIRISGIFFTLKIVGSRIAGNVLSYYFVQILQMFGWGIMAVALVYYVNDIMEPEDRVKGQAYATMTYTIGSVLGAWIGGSLIDIAGVHAMLLAGIVVSAAGAAVTFFGTGTNRK